MAYKVIILYRLYMPSYVLGTFTEYPLYRRLLNIPSQFLFIALSGRKLFQKIYQEKARQH